MKKIIFLAPACAVVLFLLGLGFLSISKTEKFKLEKEKSHEKSSYEKEPFDNPLEATQNYVKRRLPYGATQLPTERYLAAYEQIKKMPVYSTHETAVKWGSC